MATYIYISLFFSSFLCHILFLLFHSLTLSYLYLYLSCLSSLASLVSLVSPISLVSLVFSLSLSLLSFSLSLSLFSLFSLSFYALCSIISLSSLAILHTHTYTLAFSLAFPGGVAPSVPCCWMQFGAAHPLTGKHPRGAFWASRRHASKKIAPAPFFFFSLSLSLSISPPI